MISVNTNHLYSGYEELKSVCGSLWNIASDMQEIRKCVSEVSGMADAVALLHQPNNELCTYVDQCRWLCQSLDTICQLYQSCENRILDYGESAIIHYSYQPTAFLDLSAATEILGEFSFVEERGD